MRPGGFTFVAAKGARMCRTPVNHMWCHRGTNSPILGPGVVSWSPPVLTGLAGLWTVMDVRDGDEARGRSGVGTRVVGYSRTHHRTRDRSSSPEVTGFGAAYGPDG